MSYKVTKKTPKVIEEEITIIEIEFPLVFASNIPGTRTLYKITKEGTKFYCIGVSESFITGNNVSDMDFSFAVLRASSFEEFVIENESAIKKSTGSITTDTLQRMEDLIEEFTELFKK